jgi:predicted secreted protein
MRALAVALLLLLLAAASARAGDNAERGLALFSPDGRYFAFEQFGVQDGSGFPFSDIHVIDTERDEWVRGTPIRELIESEDATVTVARTSAASKASAIFTSLYLTEPVELIAANPATEFVEDRRKVTFAPWFQSQGWDEKIHGTPVPGRYTLAVSLLPFPMAEACWGEEAKQWGFALTIRDNDTGTEQEAYRDTAIPASRLCPMGYDIGEILVYRAPPAQDRYVALIAMYTPGFEGLNRRLLAIPFKLP